MNQNSDEYKTFDRDCEDVDYGSSEKQKHYMTSGDQPIEIMEHQFSKDELHGFLKGNVVKYILRCNKKNSLQKDVDKALQYLIWLALSLRGHKIRPTEYTINKLLMAYGIDDDVC